MLAGMRERIAVSCLIALTGGLWLWSWRKWPDLLVDFGTNVTISWRLSMGATLFKDVFTFYGPLAPYLNALVLKWGGHGLTSLFAVNFVVLCAIAALIFGFFRKALGFSAGTLACALFLLLFAFAQYTQSGNYNFMAPYKPDVGYGVLFALLMIWQLQSMDVPGKSTRHCASFAGLFLGLTLLTTLEIAVACACASVVALTLARPGWKVLTVFLVSAVVPPFFTFLWFLHAFLPADALMHTLNGLLSPFWYPELSKNAYMLRTQGLDRPLFNCMLMAVGSVGVGAIFGAGYAIDRRMSFRWIAVILGFSFFPVLSLSPRGRQVWDLFFRSLPVVCVVLTVGYVWARSRFMALWGTFSVALLLKIMLHTRIFHYGFYLAMPATLFVVVSLANARREGRRLWCTRSLAYGLTGGMVFFYLSIWAPINAAKTLAISGLSQHGQPGQPGRNDDLMMTYPAQISGFGPAVRDYLNWCALNVPPDATMQTLPDAVFLSYLSRRVDPSAYPFGFSDDLAYGESTVLESIARAPAQFLALVTQDKSEYGRGQYGTGVVGKETLAWVAKNYVEIEKFGTPALIHVFRLRSGDAIH